MCIPSVFTTFLMYFTYGEDLVYCRPFPMIITLIVTNCCLHMEHEPVEQNVGEDLVSNTQQAYSSIIWAYCYVSLFVYRTDNTPIPIFWFSFGDPDSTKFGLAFFINSACIRSIPGALLSLSLCMAFSASSNIGVGSSVSKYTLHVSLLRVVAFWLEHSIFSSSSKCSAHLLSI